MAAENGNIKSPCTSTSTFNLHDAMSATHITHPKMDSCEIPLSALNPAADPRSNSEGVSSPETYVHPRPIPTEGLRDPFHSIPWDDLTLDDAAFILVRVLTCLPVLFDGASVGESVLTCLYAHDKVVEDMKAELFPESIEDKMDQLLRVKNAPKLAVFSSILVLLHFTELFRTIVSNADIYEEEDFVLNTHGVILYTERDTLQLSRITETTLEVLSLLEKNVASEIITSILRIQLCIMKICFGMANLGSAELKETVKVTQAAVEEAIVDLQKVSEMYLNLQASREKQDITRLLSRCFDPYVNRPLIGNLPVRHINTKEPDDALRLLLRNLYGVRDILLKTISKANRIGRIQRMLDKTSRNDSDILLRSLFLLNLYFEEKLIGQYDLQESVTDLMRYRMEVPKGYLESEYAGLFLGRMEKPFYDTLKLRLFNRSRQRAFIEAVLLPDWSVLLEEAQQVDAVQQAEQNHESTTVPHFYFFVLSVILNLIDRHISLGIELSIFQGGHQLMMAFWYRDFVLSANLQHLSQMKTFQDKNTEQSEARGKVRNKKKSRDTVKKRKKTDEDLEEDFEMVVLGVRRMLCRATFQFMIILRQLSLLKEPTFEFTSVETIFRRRFEVFEVVKQPPALSYEDYKQGSNFSKVPSKDFLNNVADTFQQCRSTLDQLLTSLGSVDRDFVSLSEENIRGLIKVCVGNVIYIRKVEQLIKSDAAEASTVSFDFSNHPEFCTIKIA